MSLNWTGACIPTHRRYLRLALQRHAFGTMKPGGDRQTAAIKGRAALQHAIQRFFYLPRGSQAALRTTCWVEARIAKPKVRLKIHRDRP